MRGSLRSLCRFGHPVVALFCAMALSLCSAGCDRAREWIDKLPFKSGEKARGDKTFTDTQKVLKKFGNPAERLGIGKTVHTENGIRYNRKWNYYYSSTDPKMPSMRTVYFVDEKFTGSVVRQPDGNIIKEDIRFPY